MSIDQNNRFVAERLAQKRELIADIQNAILANPEPAFRVGGWHPYKTMMRTCYRPDGSDGGRPDKMVIKMRPAGYIYVTYNGTSWRSGTFWNFLKPIHGAVTNDELIRALSRAYRIQFDWDSWDARKANNVKFKAKAKAPIRQTAMVSLSTLNNEICTAVVPDEFVKKTVSERYVDTLRSYLIEVFGFEVMADVYARYLVGAVSDGRTVFWKIDQQGRVRNGKLMRYGLDGHRDKATPNSILAVPAILKSQKKIPEDQKFDDVLFGEHLLADHRDKPVGLVESEKTALVLTAAMPGFVWIATGGATQNIERARTLLAGCNVTVFPDADAEEQWRKYFASEPGWKFDIICSQVAKERGTGWEKCDLADIIISERR